MKASCRLTFVAALALPLLVSGCYLLPTTQSGLNFLTTERAFQREVISLGRKSRFRQISPL